MIEQRRAPAHDFSQRMLWLMGPELGKCPASNEGFSGGGGLGQPPLRLSWVTQHEGLKLCEVSSPRMSNGASADASSCSSERGCAVPGSG